MNDIIILDNKITLKTNQTDFLTLQTLVNTLNTSVNVNSFDLAALSLTVQTGFVSRYLKSEIDALLTTISTNKFEHGLYNSTGKYIAG